MQIIVVRHAVAEDRESFEKKNSEDHLRPLTEKGRRRMIKVAQRVRDWVEDIDLIVSSPYLRAKQTADILSEIYSGIKIVEAPELVPQSPPLAFIKWLRAHGRNLKQIIIVGHEPHLSSLVSCLLSGGEEAFIELKKSGVACLEIESFHELAPGHAQLNWLIQPRLIGD